MITDDLTDMQIRRREMVKQWEELAETIHINLPQEWKIRIGTTPGMKYPFTQVMTYRPDALTGEMGWGAGGKAYISEYMTKSEFYQLILGLALAYVQHELREAFHVNGERPFHPHIDTFALIEASRTTDAREVPTVVD